jgi:protein TonB
VPASDKSTRRLGSAISLALHALAGAALLSYEPARTALLSAAPVMVSLISPPALPQPEPPEVPPKPKAVVKALPKPPEPAALIMAPVEAPSPVVVPPPPPPPPPAEPALVVAPPLVVTPPIFDADYLDNPAPAYPVASRRGGEQGRVVLRVLVNPGGSADEVQIRTSSGFVRLDEAARDTVRRWRFVPARRGEEAVPAWVLIPISFRLEGN